MAKVGYSDPVISSATTTLIDTVPAALAREIKTNPVLRADRPEVAARWGGGDPVAVFAALREAKNSFA